MAHDEPICLVGGTGLAPWRGFGLFRRRGEAGSEGLPNSS
jgi:sulfite reductase alpha subunit-like flavoprotein